MADLLLVFVFLRRYYSATLPSELKKKRAVGLFRVPHGCLQQESTALCRLCAQTVAEG
jgi:hypothetical protein